MKLNRVHIKNIKCFDDYGIDIIKPGTKEPLSTCVLVGPNGSGKSTVLEAIVSALTSADDKYGGRIFDKRAIKFGRKSYRISLDFVLNEAEMKEWETEETEFELNVLMRREDDMTDEYRNYLLYPDEIINLPSNTEKEEEYKEERKDVYEDILFHFIESETLGCVLYFDSFRYVPNTIPNGINMDFVPNVRSNALCSNVGEDNTISNKYFNVKQWLLNLDYKRLKEEGNYYKQVYQHMISAIELMFAPLVLSRIETNGDIIFYDAATKEEIDFCMLSDGFKSLFSIIGAMIMRLALMGERNDIPFYKNEAIVLIDEIDCHIHPRWQRNILPGLKKLFPNCQYIVSTHSPYILESVQQYEIKQIGGSMIV